MGRTDEVFITGTAVEVTPIAEIAGQTFKVGDITKTLMTDYDNLVNAVAIQAAAE